MTDSIKQTLTNDMKLAMKAGEKQKLSTIRAMLAAFKQIEVDERITLDDARALAVLDKMAKQRRESIAQYEVANRQDLIDIEQAELAIIQLYLPEPLSEQEILGLIDSAIASIGATSMADMGRVMALLKPQIQGRADMSEVSKLLKNRLG
ncbi:MAG: GatB/YqeY domain-containing protein [Gammaproteobacteria bacterium]|nr:GatB/YqeY domain-containing protein [Gammaproteobacteria bacterium]